MHLHSKQSGSGASRCFCAIYLYPFCSLRAGDGGHFCTVAEAYVILGALVVWSLEGGTVGRGLTWEAELTLMREPGFESPNHQGRGTQWSVGPGGGLEVWGGGLWSAAEGTP